MHPLRTAPLRLVKMFMVIKMSMSHCKDIHFSLKKPYFRLFFVVKK